MLVHTPLCCRVPCWRSTLDVAVRRVVAEGGKLQVARFGDPLRAMDILLNEGGLPADLIDTVCSRQSEFYLSNNSAPAADWIRC